MWPCTDVMCYLLKERTDLSCDVHHRSRTTIKLHTRRNDLCRTAALKTYSSSERASRAHGTAADALLFYGDNSGEHRTTCCVRRRLKLWVSCANNTQATTLKRKTWEIVIKYDILLWKFVCINTLLLYYYNIIKLLPKKLRGNFVVFFPFSHIY